MKATPSSKPLITFSRVAAEDAIVLRRVMIPVP